MIWTTDGQHLILIDNSGNQIDDITLSNNLTDGYSDLGLSPSGNIVMAGTFSDRGKILVCDDQGTVLDSVSTSSDKAEELSALAVSSSGDIMAVGWQKNQAGVRQVLLVKITTSY